MRSKIRFLAMLTGLVVAIVAVLGWQQRTAERLRVRLATQQASVSELARLKAEHQRLEAAQLKPEVLDRLVADRNAVTALLGEIEAMKRRAESVVSAGKTSAPARPLQRSMKDGLVAAALWKNAGQATPEATFETALWAGAGGNVESLARLLSFDADAQAKAEAIFAKLPPALRQELATPERLIALLVAKDVPLGSAQILTQITPTDPAAETKLRVRLFDAEGKSKETNLSLRSQDGSWRFVVPPRTIEKYTTLLQTPVAAR